MRDGFKFESEFYDSYEDYVEVQTVGALRKKGITKRSGVGGVNWCLNYLKQNLPDVSFNSVFCIGARDDSELLEFEKHGYTVAGIDLYETDRITKCDMSLIHEHPLFKEAKYDFVYSRESMEHCVDLDGFIMGLNQICSKYFWVTCPNLLHPLLAPSKWDCGTHSFMGCFEGDGYREALENTFTEFNVLLANQTKFLAPHPDCGCRCWFLLERKSLNR